MKAKCFKLGDGPLVPEAPLSLKGIHKGSCKGSIRIYRVQGLGDSSILYLRDIGVSDETAAESASHFECS